MEPERLNSPDTSAILFELMGHQLQFSQDPNSKHLGTTVWDASMVFAKFLEKNCRKGRFSPSKLKGKRAVELGAGCGVAGLGMAFLGCDVVSTDQTEVLPLLMRNVERNTSRIMQTDPGSESFGSIEVAELNWGNFDHIKAVGPPFDYIIGTDVVYAEHLLEPLLQTMLALSGPKTTILLGYEMRSTNVHEQMLNLWKRHFEVKNVPKAKRDLQRERKPRKKSPKNVVVHVPLLPPANPRSKRLGGGSGNVPRINMDSKYQHSSIQVLIMVLKPSEVRAEPMSHGLDQQIDEVGTIDTTQVENEEADNSICMVDFGDNKSKEACVLAPSTLNGNLSEWEARRLGSMAARLLQDVRIS